MRIAGTLTEYFLKKGLLAILFAGLYFFLLYYLSIENSFSPNLYFMIFLYAIYFLFLAVSFKDITYSTCLGIYYSSILIILTLWCVITAYSCSDAVQKKWILAGAFAIGVTLLLNLLQRITLFKHNCNLIKKNLTDAQLIDTSTGNFRKSTTYSTIKNLQQLLKKDHVKAKAIIELVSILLIAAVGIFIFYSSGPPQQKLNYLAFIVFAWFFSAMFMNLSLGELEFLHALKELKKDWGIKTIRRYYIGSSPTRGSLT